MPFTRSACSQHKRDLKQDFCNCKPTRPSKRIRIFPYLSLTHTLVHRESDPSNLLSTRELNMQINLNSSENNFFLFLSLLRWNSHAWNFRHLSGTSRLLQSKRPKLKERDRKKGNVRRPLGWDVASGILAVVEARFYWGEIDIYEQTWNFSWHDLDELLGCVIELCKRSEAPSCLTVWTLDE